VTVTVDLVVFTIRAGGLHVLLVRRGQQPYLDELALPGGFLEPDQDDDLDATAARELAEETGLHASALHLEQLGAYSAADRDPRGRVVTIAFVGLVPQLPEPAAGGDANGALWTPIDPAAPGAGLPGSLAFDHDQILADGLARVQQQLEHTALAPAFCPPEFSLSELRQVYETVWGVPLDIANFRRKALGVDGFLLDTGRTRTDVGRPAKLYRRGPATQLHPPMPRPPVPHHHITDGEER
jgi:8-oxo-dGTP diphosphatase